MIRPATPTKRAATPHDAVFRGAATDPATVNLIYLPNFFSFHGEINPDCDGVRRGSREKTGVLR